MVIGLFWLGWSAKPDVHWIVPMLSGLAFGSGFLLIFMVSFSNPGSGSGGSHTLDHYSHDCRHC